MANDVVGVLEKAYVGAITWNKLCDLIFLNKEMPTRRGSCLAMSWKFVHFFFFFVELRLAVL